MHSEITANEFIIRLVLQILFGATLGYVSAKYNWFNGSKLIYVFFFAANLVVSGLLSAIFATFR